MSSAPWPPWPSAPPGPLQSSPISPLSSTLPAPASPPLDPEIHNIATAAVRRYHDILLALGSTMLGQRILTPWPETSAWTADDFLEVAANYRRLCVYMWPLQREVDWKWRHDHEAAGVEDLVRRGRWATSEAAVLENWLSVCGYLPLGDRVREEVWRW
ncbi:hypothetical protein EDC01DRAFT_780058 [Geopyxis carbonaria]|nr:hypothetical protein EDC01DRAFT_780058 [Geopyxis carbonaria]